MRELLITFIFFSWANSFAQESHAKIFPFKSAIIEYKYEAGMEGTHIKYIDDFGYKQADYMRKEIHIGADTEKQYETIILVGKRAYTIDYKTSTVAIGRNSTYSYYLNNPNILPERINEALIKAEGYTEIEKTNYLGRKCKVWKAEKAKETTWKSIPLETTYTFFMMIVEKATKIKVNVNIPSSVFEIPQGFKYISSDVYQGYAGLELSFDKRPENTNLQKDSSKIKVNFNSSSLESCNSIPFYTQEGEKVVQNGTNDYNKIDLEIIKSQTWQLDSDTTHLSRFRTLIFMKDNCYGEGVTCFGKVQINNIDDNTFSYRYMIFDKENNITGYSDNANNALNRIIKIEVNHKNKSITIIPVGDTKTKVLGW